MEKLNELAELARLCVSMKSSVDANAAYANFICRIEPKDITAIAEAFRELEQRAEAAESNSNYNGGDARYWHDEYCAQQRRLVSKIVALEESLAELAKQEPVAYTDAEEMETLRKGTFADMFTPCDAYKSDPQWIPLFTRAAPAADLAELVPDKWYFQLTLDIPNLDNMTPYQAHGAAWEQCRTAMLRKIEEVK